VTHDPYGDDELAAFYDLEHAAHDDDLTMYEQFARRGELPSLELGVGSGRVALHLARQGLRVTGIDTSLAMLTRATAALDERTAPCAHFAEADMRDFDLAGEKFDLVYCALGTFEHLLATDDQIAALRCVARHLAPGGVFVAQLRALAAVDWTQEYAPLIVEWSRDDGEGGVVTKTSGMTVSPAAQTTISHVIFDRAPSGGGPVRRRSVDVTRRVFGRFEFELLLGLAGLRLAQLYGDCDLSPFDDRGDTMVAVAEREGS
jgi:SAM-dependent methyltransferase